MKIAFWGLQGSFNHDQVGGVNSTIRRLADSMTDSNEITFIYYECKQSRSMTLPNNIRVVYLTNLASVFEELAKGYKHVVSIYIKPLDRLMYAHYRRRNHRNVYFHHIYFVLSESAIKRTLLFAEAKYFPFNGCLFCVSPRIYQSACQLTPAAKILLPPVPNSYFMKPDMKIELNKIRVTFCGRLDPGKGIREVVELFECLKVHSNVEPLIFGFPWKHKLETSGLHEQLLGNDRINYRCVNYERWSPLLDDELREVLSKTDILLLPYKQLSSTVDMPLLLLEGMASLCAIVTPPLGNLHDIYGDSPFNLSRDWDIDAIFSIIEKAHLHLKEEKRRIYIRNQSLGFNEEDAKQIFTKAIEAIV